jgi:hypothetical protein
MRKSRSAEVKMVVMDPFELANTYVETVSDWEGCIACARLPRSLRS